MARGSGLPKLPSGAATPTLWDEPGDPTWSVPELGEAIGLSLRAAFPDEVWVRGVIRNLNPGRRGGTVWFDLVEPAVGGDLSRPPQARSRLTASRWPTHMSCFSRSRSPGNSTLVRSRSG